MKIPHRVLLADDAAAVRESVRSLLEREGFDVVAEAGNGQEAVSLAQAVDPDVAVLDLSMPKLSGMGAARQIQQLCPRTQLILLTVHAEEHQVAAALRAGIRGYVAKTEAAEDLVRAIGEVSRGGVFVSSTVRPDAMNEYLPKNDSCLLLDPKRSDSCPLCGFCPSSEEEG